MSIDHFFNKAIIIKRLSVTSGYKRHMVSTGTIDAQIQQLSQGDSTNAAMVYGATHKAWVDISADVKEGDQVVDPGGDMYTVVDVIVEGEGIAANEHLALLLKRYKEDGT